MLNLADSVIFFASCSVTHNCLIHFVVALFSFIGFSNPQIGANAPLSWVVAKHQTHFNWLIELLIILIFFANQKKTRTEEKLRRKKHVRRTQEMSWDWTLNFMLFGRCSRSHVGNFAFVLVLFGFVRVLVESRCFFFQGMLQLLSNERWCDEWGVGWCLILSRRWFIILVECLLLICYRPELSGNVMDVDVEGTWKAKNVALQSFTFNQTRRRLSSCSVSWMSMQRWTHFFLLSVIAWKLVKAEKREKWGNKRPPNEILIYWKLIVSAILRGCCLSSGGWMRPMAMKKIDCQVKNKNQKQLFRRLYMLDDARNGNLSSTMLLARPALSLSGWNFNFRPTMMLCCGRGEMHLMSCSS